MNNLHGSFRHPVPALRTTGFTVALQLRSEGQCVVQSWSALKRTFMLGAG